MSRRPDVSGLRFVLPALGAQKHTTNLKAGFKMLWSLVSRRSPFEINGVLIDLTKETIRHAHKGNPGCIEYIYVTAEQRDQVATELKRFAQDLNLNDEQKDKLHSALAEGREKIGDYLKDNPNTPKASPRRRRIAPRFVNALLTFWVLSNSAKWDSELAKAKEFLGQKVDA